MMQIERDLHSAEKVFIPSSTNSSLKILLLLISLLMLKNIKMSQEKDHYEGIMTNKVLFDIKEAERQYQELECHRKVIMIAFYSIYSLLVYSIACSTFLHANGMMAS